MYEESYKVYRFRERWILSFLERDIKALALGVPTRFELQFYTLRL